MRAMRRVGYAASSTIAASAVVATRLLRFVADATLGSTYRQQFSRIFVARCREPLPNAAHSFSQNDVAVQATA